MTVASVGDNCVSVYLGAVGEDADAELILAGAVAAAVDVSRVRRMAAPTGVTLVQLGADGDRAFVEERYGASAAYRPAADDITFLRGCDWVHCANLAAPAELVEQLAGTAVSYDFAVDHAGPHVDRLAPQLAIAFFSGAELARDQAVALARRAVGAGAGMAVVTRGRSGSVALNSRVVEVAAEPVEVVDTLGAGDALIAAVIASRLRGMELDEALAAGSAAAARACTHYGAWEQT